MPGPAPKPTKLRLLQGNPGKRPVNDREPDPDASRFNCPRWLPDAAKREWRRVVPELRRLELLTRVDSAALQAYCTAYARWVQAEGVIEAEGLTYETETGYVRPRPEIQIANEAMKLMRSFLTEFGMTPAARTRVKLPEPKEEADPFAQFLAASGQAGKVSNG